MSDRIKYIRIEDIIKSQKDAENEMIEEFERGEYTLENPLVKLNPYRISPCTAVIMFKTKNETSVTTTVLGKEVQGNITHIFPKAKQHILPVLGLYPDYENTVEITLYQGRTKTVKIHTQKPEIKLAEVNYMQTTSKHLQDNLIFVMPALSGYPTGFDYQGNIRWYLNKVMLFELKRLKNGHILVGTDRRLRYPYYTSGLYEMDMTGKIYNEYLIPGDYHHDHLELPNGDLVVLSEDASRDTVEDTCVLIDRKSGAVKKIWDFKDFLTPGDAPSGSWTEHDWFHNNSVWYDEKNNSLTLSGRHMDAIVNIDFDTGKLNWIIGDSQGWPEEKKKFFFTPEGREFEWQYEQHAASVTPEGDVLCFDNGHFRSKDKNSYRSNNDNFSRGVRYKIDTRNMLIRQIWQYGKERGAEFFSQYISNVEYLGEDHYLIHSGGIQFYGDKAAEIFLPPIPDPLSHFNCITVEMVRGEKVLELKIEGNYYRSKKMPLYCENTLLEFGEGSKKGVLAVSKEVEHGGDYIGTEQPIPEEYMVHIIEQDDYFTLKARFSPEDKVALILSRDEEKHEYAVSTESTKFAPICCIPYIAPDPENISATISKRGLTGIYIVSLVVNGSIYKTAIQIKC